VPAYGDRVGVVRKHLPVAQIHPYATAAAHAAVCAEEQGKGDRMADALFRAPTEEIDAPGSERLAERVGLDMDAYRACIASDRPAKRVAADLADAAAAGLKKSVPVLIVGRETYRGAQPQHVIKAAIERQLPPR
jgi:predicted DsbA family dithiol-disulfide isomerase